MRLVTLYNSASVATRNAGATWYQTARKAARSMARDTGTTESVAAGVIAALSPRIHWVRNIKAARDVLATGKATGVFRVNLAKARRILAGERPLAVLSGPKTRAFYRAIMGDESAAVIDVWMLRAVRFKGGKPSERDYNRITRLLAKAAALVKTTIAKLQAVVWSVIRGKAT